MYKASVVLKDGRSVKIDKTFPTILSAGEVVDKVWDQLKEKGYPVHYKSVFEVEDAVL